MLIQLQTGKINELDLTEITRDFSTVNKIDSATVVEPRLMVATGIHSGRNTNTSFPRRRLISKLEKSSSKYKKEATAGKRKRHECSFCHIPSCSSIATCSVLIRNGFFRIKSKEINHFISFYFIPANAKYDKRILSSCVDSDFKLQLYESIPKNMV